ncbi:unnamed protein product [Pleuronectes platessa]|uniref:Uncharacterized protein n=1 Tax=Pleuronectes platessa TaxID=8262 RepID=A0A9N7YFV8_PLEPL|nr:unnamed protein product [Pleuronectes platessa]
MAGEAGEAGKERRGCRLSGGRIEIETARGAQIREANLIWTHDRANPSQLRNEKAVWSDSIPKASIESSSQMLVPFAALELLEYDEKGLGRVQWLSHVYDRRDWWSREAQYEDREMK